MGNGMENTLYFTQPLSELWQSAVEQYRAGKRGAEDYFTSEQNAFLASIGHSAQEVYDFAEDFVNYGEPDRETFLLIAAQRVFYYRNVMRGQCGDKVVDTKNLPPKTDSVAGIEWLPRLIEKAKAKLRGEMSTDLMYCCGGDRKFFQQHQIHPAEFLQFVAANPNNDAAVVAWVSQR